jgi:hypothetical protein
MLETVVAVPDGHVNEDVNGCDAAPAQIETPVPVGGLLFVKVTSSLTEPQELETVHLNVAIVPAGTVAVEVGEVGAVMVAVPLTTVQVPVVPAAGAVAPRVKVKGPLLQLVWSDPAFAEVGAALTFTVTLDVAGQLPLGGL